MIHYGNCKNDAVAVVFWVSIVLLYNASSFESGSNRQKILHKFLLIFSSLDVNPFFLSIPVSHGKHIQYLLFLHYKSFALSLSHRESSVVLCVERTVIREQFGSISFSSIITGVFPA